MANEVNDAPICPLRRRLTESNLYVRMWRVIWQYVEIKTNKLLTNTE